MTPLRLDDLGASSKAYEWWSRHRWANVWPLHHRKLFGAWGPYRELTAWQLRAIFHAVERHGAQMTVAITACWVERDGTLTPYSQKWPDQADVVREFVRRDVIAVAAHGLTHCVPGKHLPRWIRGNRPSHREPPTRRPSQAIGQLSDDLGIYITRYVAPGEPAGTTEERVFHDREFVLDWDNSMRTLTGVLRG